LILRPSSAHRWTRCPSSEHLLRSPNALPEADTDAAREGTCAAWVAECVINGDATHCDDLVGKTHENGWFVDQQMADHIQPYVKMLQSRDMCVAEVLINANPITGTLDAKSTKGTTLYIDDLKYGYRIVEPTTPQLVCYMAGVLQEGVANITHVQLGIYQPRAQHPEGIYRTITLTIAEAREQANAIVAIANDVVQGVGCATPGPHCSNCLRAHDCTALAHSVYEMWDVVNANGLLEPTGTDVANELALLTRLSDILSARKTAVEADAEERIKRNEFVPGWSMVERYGKRMFTLDRESIKTMTGFDPVEEKMVTPAALERMGADKDLVKAMTKTPMIGRKLKPVTDKTIAKLFER